MNLFELTVPQLAKTLHNLDRWLKAGEQYAEQRKFPVDNLIQARLAPDQYPLVRQVQSSCDNVKFIAGRLTQKDWPAQAETETTFEQLHLRIAAVQTYLEGKWMTGAEYVTQFALPNFYFHVTLAYAILRHNGVPLGKTDFIGSAPMRD